MTTLKARLEDASTALGILATSCDENELEKIQPDLEPILKVVQTSVRLVASGIGKAMTSGRIQKRAPAPTQKPPTAEQPVCDHDGAGHDREACSKARQDAHALSAIQDARRKKIITLPGARLER